MKLVDRIDLAVTALGVAATALAVASEDLRAPLVAIASAAFVAGAALMAAGVVIGSARSREESVTLGGLLLVAGPHHSPGRRRLLRALAAVQSVVGVAGAVARPFTTVAFAVLVPMFGLGVMAWVGARDGDFDPRSDDR